MRTPFLRLSLPPGVCSAEGDQLCFQASGLPSQPFSCPPENPGNLVLWPVTVLPLITIRKHPSGLDVPVLWRALRPKLWQALRSSWEIHAQPWLQVCWLWVGHFLRRATQPAGTVTWAYQSEAHVSLRCLLLSCQRIMVRMFQSHQGALIV